MLTMSDVTLPREFTEYKQRYPEFFPDDQPIKKQIAYFKALRAVLLVRVMRKIRKLARGRV
jgi:hypothetical protein